MRKTIDIEKLVTWAYRDELPKAVGGSGGIASIRSGYESITQYGELLTMIDRTNVYGMVPAFAADDDGPPPTGSASAASEIMAPASRRL